MKIQQRLTALLLALLLLLTACSPGPPPTPTPAANNVNLPLVSGQPTTPTTNSVSLPLVSGPALTATANSVNLPLVSAAEATASAASYTVTLPLIANGGTATAATPVPATPVPATPVPATSVPATPGPGTPARFGYRVINTYPHDRAAFTQGLVYVNGVLYEGTGLVGQSTLRKVELATGTVLQKRDLPADVFGEGIVVVDDRIFQLTWQSQVGYIYNRDTFELLRTFNYNHEGWGITYDGQRLIMSDGTATLRFWNLETQTELGRVEVRDENGPVTQLNELEWIDGAVYANIWQTDRIARIDPATGRVTAWVDLTGLLPEADRSGADVLNGIAYDPATRRMFVTGKFWPKLFEIQLVPVP